MKYNLMSECRVEELPDGFQRDVISFTVELPVEKEIDIIGLTRPDTVRNYQLDPDIVINSVGFGTIGDLESTCGDSRIRRFIPSADGNYRAMVVDETVSSALASIVTKGTLGLDTGVLRVDVTQTVADGINLIHIPVNYVVVGKLVSDPYK